ncbi:MAG: PTS glucitol/sorbitol transporter subunit IIA [Anaerolineales bacterium]
MIKYTAHITGIGPLLAEFTDAGVLVFFGQSAPEELMEFAVIHDGQTLAEPVAAGDEFVIGEARYRITVVGEVANQNLANLGHFVVKFNAAAEAELPGDICAEARSLPPIEVGMQFQIVGHE